MTICDLCSSAFRLRLSVKSVTFTTLGSLRVTEAMNRVTAPPGREEIRRSGSGTQSTRSLGNCWSKWPWKYPTSQGGKEVFGGEVLFFQHDHWKLWNCETSVWRWSRFQLKSWSMLIHIDSSPRARKASKKVGSIGYLLGKKKYPWCVCQAFVSALESS